MSEEVLHKTAQDEAAESAEIATAIMLTSSITEAAESLKMSRRNLYYKIEKYNLREIIEKKKLEAYDTLLSSANKAAENFVKKIDSTNQSISMDASREVLDRVGIHKQDGKSTNIQVNITPILDFKAE